MYIRFLYAFFFEADKKSTQNGFETLRGGRISFPVQYGNYLHNHSQTTAVRHLRIIRNTQMAYAYNTHIRSQMKY